MFFCKRSLDARLTLPSLLCEANMYTVTGKSIYLNYLSKTKECETITNCSTLTVKLAECLDVIV